MEPERRSRGGSGDPRSHTGVGEARAFPSIDAMVKDPAIDAIWICGPNHERVANMETIVEALENGGELVGIACEKPLARNLAEAKKVLELVKRAGVLDDYLENQVFQPSVTKGKALLWSRGASAAGRPYLARSAEEHSGPHAKWFWQGELQGGGVLNDMMCHSIEAARYLLTEPGKPRESLVAKKVSAQIACLKMAATRLCREAESRLWKRSRLQLEAFGGCICLPLTLG